MTDGLQKIQTRSKEFVTAHSEYFYFPTRLWAENPHWISFVLLYCYYHSLISKRICVVDPLSGAFNVSWLTWIYQRWNVIVVMMFAAEQPSLAWVQGNTCLGRKNIGEHWFPSWGHRFSFWNLIPRDNELSLSYHKVIKLNHALPHFFLEQDKSTNCIRTEAPQCIEKNQGSYSITTIQGS